MRPKPSRQKSPGEGAVQDIRRATRKHYASVEKISIVPDGRRGEDSIAEKGLCKAAAQSVWGCRR